MTEAVSLVSVSSLANVSGADVKVDSLSSAGCGRWRGPSTPEVASSGGLLSQPALLCVL